MFRLNCAFKSSFVLAALGAASAMAALPPMEVPIDIVDAATNEVRDGTIVAVYLDPEITSSPVYRVIMDTPDWDRRLTIRGDGVVLNKQRLYEDVSARSAHR